MITLCNFKIQTYCCSKQFCFITQFVGFILGKRQEIEIQHCLATLCHEAPVVYDENLYQLTALTRSSGKCSQEITLMCLLAPTKVCIYSLNTFKWHKSKKRNLRMKSSKIVFIFLPGFYLIIWLMESPKKFEKIAILKIWQLVFFIGVKTDFGEIPLKSYIFRHDKNWFSPILPHDSYYCHVM